MIEIYNGKLKPIKTKKEEKQHGFKKQANYKKQTANLYTTIYRWESLKLPTFGLVITYLNLS